MAATSQPSQPAKSAVQSSEGGVRALSASTPVSASAAAAVAASPAAKLSIHDADIPGMPAAQPDRRHDSPDPKTPTVFSFFEKVTATWQYVVADLKYGDAVVIDPVLDYDPASGNISTKTADGLLGFVWAHGLNVTRILCVLRSCVYV